MQTQLTKKYTQIISSLQKQGALSFPMPSSPGIRQTIKEAKEWLKDAENELPSMPAGDTLPILEGYDLLHRICHATPAPAAMLRTWTDKAFQALIKGDKSICRSKLAAFLAPLIARNPQAIDPRHIAWYADVTTRWVNQHKRTGTFPGETPEEIRRRLGILLRADLFAHLGSSQNTEKSRWLRQNKISGDSINS